MLSIFSINTLGMGALVVFLIWLSWITYIIYKNKSSDKKSLPETITELKAELDNNKKIIQIIKREFEEEKNKSHQYLQKIGFKRFNPFGDTGGQQSFIISILDNNSDGVVISSLYGRNGTHWFAKKVNSGKGLDLELTEEEKETI